MIVLIAAVVLLAAVTAGHLLLTFALIRRVRELQNQAATGPRDTGLPEIGTPVGRFSVQPLDGGRLDTEDLATGDTLVGFFAAGCAPCETVVADLLETPPAERFVAFVDESEAEPTRELATRLRGIAEVAVVPWDSALPAAFKQEGFPTLLRVRDGVVVAAGRKRADVGTLAVR